MPTTENAGPFDQAYLRQLKHRVPDYRVGQPIADELRRARKSFTSVSGPIGVGKTTISDRVVELESRIQLADTTTNRPGKKSDPPGFRTAKHGITLAGMIDDINERRVLNYDVIPETGTIYAFYPEGLQADHSIGPLTASNVNTFLNLDLEEYNPVYVISPVEMWRQFIVQSIGERPDLVYDRMEETVESLEFARDNVDVFRFVENRLEPGGIDRAAEAIISIAFRQTYPIITAPAAAQSLDEMIAYAKKLAVQ